MGNLAYNPDEQIYLVHDGTNGPTGNIMEGCCCGLGLCAPCDKCITAVISYSSPSGSDYYAVVAMSNSLSKCHSSYNVSNIPLLDEDSVESGYTANLSITVTADDMYVKISIDDYIHSVVHAHAPGSSNEEVTNPHMGCDAWDGKKVKFEGDDAIELRRSSGGDNWEAAGSVSMRVYFGPPSNRPLPGAPPGSVCDSDHDGYAPGLQDSYKVNNINAINNSTCLVSSSSWNGVLDSSTGHGPWSYSGGHNNHEIKVDLIFDDNIGRYRLIIKCPGSEEGDDLYSEVKAEACGGPEGTYGSFTVEAE